MLIRLNVPYKWHKVLDIIDSEDLGPAVANRLIRRGNATKLEDVVTERGGGWYDVEVHYRDGSASTEKVHGLEAAVRLLREAAGQ